MLDIRGPQGNAFTILGHVQATIKHTHDAEEVKTIMEDMRSGDYEHLLDIAEEYITIVGREK